MTDTLWLCVVVMCSFLGAVTGSILQMQAYDRRAQKRHDEYMRAARAKLRADYPDGD